MSAGMEGTHVPDFTICKRCPLQQGKYKSIELQTQWLIENMR